MNIYANEKFPSYEKKHVKNYKKVEKALTEIDLNHNWSWYDEVYFRWKNDLNKLAIYFRGYEITGREMFEKADILACALKKKGIRKGDEILACMANCPEAIYFLNP